MQEYHKKLLQLASVWQLVCTKHDPLQFCPHFYFTNTDKIETKLMINAHLLNMISWSSGGIAWSPWKLITEEWTLAVDSQVEQTVPPPQRWNSSHSTYASWTSESVHFHSNLKSSFVLCGTCVLWILHTKTEKNLSSEEQRKREENSANSTTI